MGFFANLKDHFTNAEFTVAPQKKLKTISADFLKAFNLALVFYKGVQIADGELTLAALNKKTTKRKRTLRQGAYADVTNEAAVKKMIPYK